MAARRRRGSAVFLAVWLTLWTSAMLVVLWLVGAALVAGDLGAAPFLLIWLVLAGFGLRAGLRRLLALTGLARQPEPPPRPPRHWHDGLGERRDGGG